MAKLPTKAITVQQTRIAYQVVVSKIIAIRGQRVMISQDIAALYGVEPRVLMQAVKRNGARFPEDFMFQLTEQELINLKSQIVTSSWGGLRKLPYAFTEQGVAMLSSVLRSECAVSVNIEIMRAFVKMRNMIDGNRELAKKISDLEDKYDDQFKIVFEAIYKLMEKDSVEEKTPKRKMGFV